MARMKDTYPKRGVSLRFCIRDSLFWAGRFQNLQTYFSFQDINVLILGCRGVGVEISVVFFCRFFFVESDSSSFWGWNCQEPHFEQRVPLSFLKDFQRCIFILEDFFELKEIPRRIWHHFLSFPWVWDIMIQFDFSKGFWCFNRWPAFLTGGKCDHLGSHSNEGGGQRLQLLSHRDQCRPAGKLRARWRVQFEVREQCKMLQEDARSMFKYMILQ